MSENSHIAVDNLQKTGNYCNDLAPWLVCHSNSNFISTYIVMYITFVVNGMLLESLKICWGKSIVICLIFSHQTFIRYLLINGYVYIIYWGLLGLIVEFKICYFVYSLPRSVIKTNFIKEIISNAPRAHH